MTDVTTLHDEESVGTMDHFTFCVILGYLVEAAEEIALYDGERAGIAKHKIIEAQEALYCWYEYGEAITLD